MTGAPKRLGVVAVEDVRDVPNASGAVTGAPKRLGVAAVDVVDGVPNAGGAVVGVAPKAGGAVVGVAPNAGAAVVGVAPNAGGAVVDGAPNRLGLVIVDVVEDAPKADGADDAAAPKRFGVTGVDVVEVAPKAGGAVVTGAPKRLGVVVADVVDGAPNNVGALPPKGPEDPDVAAGAVELEPKAKLLDTCEAVAVLKLKAGFVLAAGNPVDVAVPKRLLAAEGAGVAALVKVPEPVEGAKVLEVEVGAGVAILVKVCGAVAAGAPPNENTFLSPEGAGGFPPKVKSEDVAAGVEVEVPKAGGAVVVVLSVPKRAGVDDAVVAGFPNAKLIVGAADVFTSCFGRAFSSDLTVVVPVVPKSGEEVVEAANKFVELNCGGDDVAGVAPVDEIPVEGTAGTEFVVVKVVDTGKPKAGGGATVVVTGELKFWKFEVSDFCTDAEVSGFFSVVAVCEVVKLKVTCFAGVPSGFDLPIIGTIAEVAIGDVLTLVVDVEELRVAVMAEGFGSSA